ncbi:MAG: hypothetical protein ACXAEB_15355 [Candidatus Thorarchaeota archaeon]
MVKQWWAIAKAEFLVRTVKLHRSRKILYPIVIGIALAFALFVIPQIMSFILSEIGATFELMLATSFPGLLRTIMLVIWLMILIMPISNSLENVRIGQWEILFSNNVKTRDLLFGTFVGRIPVYGIFVIALAPIVVAPFVHAYNVSCVQCVFTRSTADVSSDTIICISDHLAFDSLQYSNSRKDWCFTSRR